MVNILALSGGRTSGYLLRYLIDSGVKLDEVIFTNTGKEHPKTLDFLHEIENRWGGQDNVA